MHKPILTIDNLTKSFTPPLSLSDIAGCRFTRKTPVCALDHVSFSLPRGKIVGILGPNGAGKTTLLKIISTLILPDKGTVSVNGLMVGKDDENIKSLIGLATPEERSFYWRLTGLENLEFFAIMSGLSKQRARQRIAELFSLFNIEHPRNRFDSYSTGTKRKYALMRALLHEPELLLLDEPAKSLDFNTTLELKKLIQGLSLQGKTVLYATHNIYAAQNLCDLFLIVHKGKIRGTGTLDESRSTTQNKTATLSEIYVRLTG